MRLCASNIGWDSEHDSAMYKFMSDSGFEGIEIAPSRIFPDNPYEHLHEAPEFTAEIKSVYGLAVSSMQSLWYGMNQRIAGSLQERRELLEYTEKAIHFSDALGCRNIVFGCPKNRKIYASGDESLIEDFLADISDIAERFDIVIALEANPEIYGTNFINRTPEAAELVKRMNKHALKINLDFGTIIANNENLNHIHEYIPLINHIHISEPELMPLKPRPEHEILREILKCSGYMKFISVEMKKQKDIADMINAMNYVREIFA